MQTTFNEEKKENSFEFLNNLIEYGLKNNFLAALDYLGNNVKALFPNLSLFVYLNVTTKEYFVFPHDKIKKKYLNLVLENIRQSELGTSLNINLSEFSTKIVSNKKLISVEGSSKPGSIRTVPVPEEDTPTLFLSFSTKDSPTPGSGDIARLNLIVNFLSTLREREEREKRARENIESYALIDQLTETFNRRAFYQFVPKDMAEGRRNGILISLIMLDVDGFKQINDAHGHSFGDLILRRVVSIFRDHLREEDKLFRLGGDEFALILKTGKREAYSVIQRILKEVNQGQKPQITFSAGIAEINPHDTVTVEHALRQADKALYMAKESGKNQVLLYEGDEINTKSNELCLNEDNLKLINDIKANLVESAIQNIISLYLSKKETHLYEHSTLVSKCAVQLGKELDLSEDALQNLNLHSILFDIGMVAVPKRILIKNRKLSPEEQEIIRQHPLLGARIIQHFPPLRRAIPIILYHHEWINGQGYPYGITGDSIPLEARVVAVADSYYAMRNDRPYRNKLSKESSISEIIKHRGVKYDPNVVDALIELMDKGLTI